MLSPLTSGGVIEHTFDGYDNLLSSQLDYFSRYLRRSKDLIEICSDKKYKNGKSLRGIKFPVAVVTESLLKYGLSNGDENFCELADELSEFLFYCFTESGFNYFEEKYLPEDLDTTSVMARLLGRKYPGVEIAYENIIARNINKENYVPTWLDTVDHQKWFAGAVPFHLDVLLNYWLTEISLGKQIRPEVILAAITKFGLNNYWYFPSLYTSYLYCRILVLLGLEREEEYLFPLISRLNEWDTDRADLFRRSNICHYPKVHEIGNTPGLADNILDQTWRDIIGSFIVKTGFVEFGGQNSFGPTAKEVDDYEGIPIYWSLGFAPFCNEPVTRAMILSSILDI